MKLCPECHRSYSNETLNFCLDDGAELLDGPGGGPLTAILPGQIPASEAATRTLERSDAVTNESLSVTPTPQIRKTAIAAVLGVLLLAVAATAAYFYLGGRSTSNKQIESIAIMPFVNASGDPDIDYLSDGITESLINSLSQVPTVSVKARSSVFTYKGKEVTLQQVAKDLSVQAVLNGRVVRIGDQIQMNVELVDALTGNQLWGEQYTRKVTDLLQMQSEIARDVSGKLKARLTGADQQRIAKNYTTNNDAYQLYLRGRYLWNKRKSDDIRKSIEYFQQAIDKDPTYALAYASLAEAYILIPAYGAGTPAEYYPKARAAAQKAIEIDPSLAEAHNALASVKQNYDWKFAEAEAEFRKTLELNPNYATGHQWYGEFLLDMGRDDESLAEINRARELDPRSLIINGLVGVVLRRSEQNEASLDQLQKTLEMEPNFPRTHLFLAELYESTGKYEEAVDEFAKTFLLAGLPPALTAEFTQKVKKAYRIDGPKGYARQIAELLGDRPRAQQPPKVVLAKYWIDAGDIDKAFDILNKAFDEHDDSLLMLKNGRLKSVESDPRYKDLIRRVGLPE
jgi:TolB-like protein/Tfp pilus assembly protein PilF